MFGGLGFSVPEEVLATTIMTTTISSTTRLPFKSFLVGDHSDIGDQDGNDIVKHQFVVDSDGFDCVPEGLRVEVSDVVELSDGR